MSEDRVKLERTLSLRAVVLFGLAYMTPLIVLGTFGVVASTTNGSVPTAYIITTIAMLFTAYSYGIMSRAFPVSGSAYTYVRKTIDSKVGFMVGWGVLLDYFFLPMVIWLIGAAYLNARFPEVPSWAFLLGFIGITTILNVYGIKLAAKVNSLLMVFQVLVIVFFVVLSLRHVFADGGTDALFSLTPFFNAESSFTTIAAGAAVAAYSFLGFDAVTTLTEETINPRRNIPRAIILTALIGGGIYVLVGYTTQLVHPGATFNDADSAAFEIATMIGADLFGAIFLAGMVLAQFTSGIAAQASASRLLFAMGRDAVLPRRLFGSLHPRYHTPVFSIVLTGVIGIVALFLDVLSAASFINFGAFIAFTMVNVSVIVMYFRNAQTRADYSALKAVVVPAIGAAVNLWLMTKLDIHAVVLGLIWLAIGLAHLAYLTRFFTRQPPEVDFSEDDTDTNTRAAEPV
ncbi:APC family permease [Marinobacter nanhaiticus D15-8W]|uniref:APC family permease n=1 Tax=Marinobacter nanhaiticus D15-8W TaxID=626887 RepID=N6X3Y5_9GAMM|nr:APC family permease [Marinobacter nanhaiticus]ENO15773.1 APC family permease [Marinobacter nanhaiticus D15-8W]BES73369.1 APC family permease [Marinobacter nanhaiticus D15-8W]